MFSKHLIANLSKVFHLIIINRNEYHTIICQQVSCNFQSWINHIEPIGVKASITFCIGDHSISLFIVGSVS